MLVKVTVTSAKRNYQWIEETHGVVLNTENISDLTVYNTSYSQFKYSVKPKDRRHVPDVIATDSSVSTIQTACESALQTELMYLPVYENDDTSTTPVTHYVPYKYFSFARPDWSGLDERCWVYVNETPSKLTRHLVALTIDEIVDYAGSTTTTSHATYD